MPGKSFQQQSSLSDAFRHICSNVNDTYNCKRTSIYFLTSAPSPGTTPKADDFHAQWSEDFLDVDSPEVNDFCFSPSLGPEQHQMSHGCLRTSPCDTMAPSAITWTPIYERLGDRRFGTVIFCISFVD
jgi:hypothetical protein